MRNLPMPDGLFKPKATTGEQKSEATTRAAQQILNAERNARESKTERLRLARLERDATQPQMPAKATRARSRSRT